MRSPLSVAAVVLAIAILTAAGSASAEKKLPPINIAHITDLHGWVFGHPHQPELNADFGDFASLLEWLQANAAARKEEFFLFDSGDLIEGTGLSDATDIHGQYIYEVVKQVKRYSALTLGNHDVGHANVVEYMHSNFVNYWQGKLVTANILLKSTRQYLGNGPYYTFTTALGTKVLVLGYLYNFTQEANNTIVVPVAESLASPYFAAAMAIPDVDMIVVTAHIDPTPPTLLRPIYNAIRKVHKKTPLCLMSGHRHITYWEKYDDSAFTIESGKYFEVLGNVRFTVNPKTQAMEGLTHRWIPTSKENLYKWAEKKAEDFMTPLGTQVRKFIDTAIAKLQLNDSVGCSPLTFDPNLPINQTASLYNLYVDQIAPKTLFSSSFPNMFFITNDGTLRYDLYKGRVVMNDIYTILPFKDPYYYYTLNGTVLAASLKGLNSGIGNSLDTHGRVPYMRMGEKGLKEGGSAYFYSTTQVQPNTTYTVLLAAYDSTVLTRVLRVLYPRATFPATPYPTAYTSTTALKAYVSEYMPCSSTCPC
eukprot:TRINITY_DN943_c0_g1_i3.p1 TRINITY_DN943_c0_g1~~TRINITY_DN943_c0_g1_i3.p1  ORF type:complete len:533 (-),score=88.76 TRINITY_DN943_c0_g1_i3:19-1617(-)